MYLKRVCIVRSLFTQYIFASEIQNMGISLYTPNLYWFTILRNYIISLQPLGGPEHAYISRPIHHNKVVVLPFLYYCVV